MLATEMKINDLCFLLVNVYAPNKDTPLYFLNLKQLLIEATQYKIIMGDFNLVLDTSVDRLNTVTNNEKSHKVLMEIMNEFLLHDVWRVCNPEEKQYTWFKNSCIQPEQQKASRIDFILCSRGLIVENVSFCPAFYTDHRTVYAAISLHEAKRGVGYWKFNNSLLTDQEYISYMTKKFETTNIQNLNPIEKWEKTKKKYSCMDQRIHKKGQKYEETGNKPVNGKN